MAYISVWPFLVSLSCLVHVSNQLRPIWQCWWEKHMWSGAVFISDSQLTENLRFEKEGVLCTCSTATIL